MSLKRLRLWWLVALVAMLSSWGVWAGGLAPLADAAKDGDTAAVRALLRQHGNVNAPDADGATALHWAVYRDDAAMAELLIRGGANVNAVSRYGVTPLALASGNGNARIIERLLAAGADPNGAQPGGETGLMTAARTGRVDALRVLLEYGADLDAAESTRGQTALMWAASEGNTAAARLLIEWGADLGARAHGPAVAEKGATAAGRGRRAKGRIDAFTPLLFAVRAGRVDTVRALIEAGASPNEAAEDGTSAIVLAVVNARWEVGGLLLDKGADPNAAAQGWTALHQLVRTRNPNIGQMPAPVATGRLSSLELAQKLVEHGANVNARMTKDMNDGARTRIVWKDCTPLLLAAKASDVEMMRFLVDHGADPKLTNAVHSTVLMLAAGLAMYHQSEDSGTDEASLEAVKLALAIGGGDVNAVDDDGDTALHGAAARDLPAISQLLIDHGARLDAMNKHKATPIMIANGFSIINEQKHPRTVALLRGAMTERALPIEMWPAGAPKIDSNVFDVNADAAELTFHHGDTGESQLDRKKQAAAASAPVEEKEK